MEDVVHEPLPIAALDEQGKSFDLRTRLCRCGAYDCPKIAKRTLATAALTQVSNKPITL